MTERIALITYERMTESRRELTFSVAMGRCRSRSRAPTAGRRCVGLTRWCEHRLDASARLP